MVSVAKTNPYRDGDHQAEFFLSHTEVCSQMVLKPHEDKVLRT